jgi:hypothetical protein
MDAEYNSRLAGCIVLAFVVAITRERALDIIFFAFLLLRGRWSS